jgi:thiol-disulfide isomerase/thioredoxin
MSMVNTILGLLRNAARRLDSVRPLLSRTASVRLVAGVSVLVVACAGGISEGEPAPDFELALFGNPNNTEGQMVKLSDFKGQPVVVNFWYPSCGPCRLEVPHLEEASRNHKDDVKFLAAQVSGFDSAEEGQAFVDELGLTFSIGFAEDPQIVADYKIIGFPSSVFLNQRHEIVRTWGGALNLEKLEELIQELLQ